MPRFFDGSGDFLRMAIGACAYNTGLLTWAHTLRRDDTANRGIVHLAGVSPAYAASCGWSQAGGGGSFADDFTSGPSLNWATLTGGPVDHINNEVECGAGHGTQTLTERRAEHDLESVDHSASAFVASEATGGDANFAGPCVRMSSSARTMYQGLLDLVSSPTNPRVAINKVVAGSYSQLSEQNYNADNNVQNDWVQTSGNAGNKITLTVETETGNARLKLYVNDVLILNTLDSSSPITTGTRCGYTIWGQNGPFLYLDTFRCADLGGGGTQGETLRDGAGTESINNAAAPANEWVILVFRKADGNAPARLSMYRFATGLWTHFTSATSLANGSTVSSEVVFGNPGQWAGGVRDFLGHLDISAFWKANLTDPQVEQLTTLSNWTTLNPVGRWRFDQLNVTTPVQDLTGNGANEIGRSGTSISPLASPFVSPTAGSNVPQHPAVRRLPLLAR